MLVGGTAGWGNAARTERLVHPSDALPRHSATDARRGNGLAAARRAAGAGAAASAASAAASKPRTRQAAGSRARKQRARVAPISEANDKREAAQKLVATIVHC